MRILFCNKYNFRFSGTEAYMFSLMQLLRDHGHEVALFSMQDWRGEPTPYDHHFVPHVEFKKAKGILTRTRLAAHAIYSRDARRRLRRMIADFKPDVAHVRNIYHHLSPSIFWELRAQKIPVLYHLNDFKLLCPSYNLVCQGHACDACHNGRFFNVVSQHCYDNSVQAVALAAEAYVHKWLKTYEHCVTKFLAPSQFVKFKLMENGWDGDQIQVLPHFQTVPECPLPEPAPERSILYFGRLSPEKGLPELLLAMQRLPHIHLDIAGEGPQRAELESLAQQLALTNVCFLGQVNAQELPSLIAKSAFTVLPTRAYETLGKTILESYAQQRAVIASDLGSRRELVEDGKTGLLFRPRDVDQLAAAIDLLHHRPELAREMGRAGYRLVRERHSPQRHYERMIALYQELVHSRASENEGRPLHVAFIGGRGVISRYSGIEAYYEEVGKRLAGMGHDVTVYCRTYFTPDVGSHQGMRLLRLPTVRSKHLDTLVHTFLSSIHVLFTRADIVHYHALGPALFSWIPRLAGKKTVVTVQGLDWQRKKWGRIASAALRLGEKAAMLFPDRTIVVSRTLENYFQTVHRTNTTCIPNGTELRKRIANGKLSEWGLEPDNYILFLGRFSPEKNCHLLIEAFERSQVSAKLVLAGGSSYSDKYVDKLRKHESDRVRLLNYVAGDALRELLTNTMLFVLPSDLEGLSLALLDAMAAGVCVLASDIPENVELIHDAGYTFQHGNIDDLERMLRLLVQDPGARVKAAIKASERIQKHYLWADIAKRIELDYLDLLGWSQKPAAQCEPVSVRPVPESEPAA